MVTQGQGFTYIVNGENKTKEDIDNMDLSNMNCTVDGLSVLYSFSRDKNGLANIPIKLENFQQKSLEDLLNRLSGSPKKETIRTKTEEIMEEVEQYQKEVNGGILKGEEFPYDFTNKDFDVITSSNRGKKETEGKLDYSEINFRLLDLMAKRFMDNKVKYPKGNSKKALDKNEILWAAFRHIRKMIQPIEDDPETYEEHLSAVLTNMSIILDQLYLEKSK